MSILVESDKGLARVTLNRPERRNALDRSMVDEIRDTFLRLGQDGSVRLIVLAGAGETFCSGADLRWMAPDKTVPEMEARRDAEQLFTMLRTINECPRPVIGRIQGGAYGGGVGLIAVCDVAVAAADAIFAFSEVRVGLVPAVIAPFVLQKTGASFARRFCLTGESFSAETAGQTGLIHEVVEPAALDAQVASIAEQITHAAPQAASDTKGLLRRLCLMPEGVVPLCVKANVRARLSREAQERLRAFRNRRPPSWIDPPVSD